MELAGRHVFDAPREIVWEALLDPEVLARTVPGCERLEPTGEDEYADAIRLAVGPVEGRFEGKVRLSELDPPNGYSIVIHGDGAQGFVNGHATVRLEGELRLSSPTTCAPTLEGGWPVSASGCSTARPG